MLSIRRLTEDEMKDEVEYEGRQRKRKKIRQKLPFLVAPKTRKRNTNVGPSLNTL